MRKKSLIIVASVWLSVFMSKAGVADENAKISKIVSVKLYQNQAEITRKVNLKLNKGQNRVVLGNLPKLLYDWSAKGKLPEKFEGKILSLEVEKKALIKKRQKRILEIEEKLEKLRDRDQALLDELKNIRSQEKFLNSILEFTNQTVSKELATRIPQVKVWDNTLNYVSKKKKGLSNSKREIERKRENLGKEIQKWEFELSQIAGYNYFNNYQTLNRVTLENRAALNVQQFANITTKYALRNKLLKKPTDKVDIEKQFIVDIFSSRSSNVEFTISYVIPHTNWQMQYDLRASNQKKSLDLVIYGNIYQKTEEDWKDVSLSLSTGSPVNAIEPPKLYPWYLDVYTPPTPVYKSKAKRYKSAKPMAQQAAKESDFYSEDEAIGQKAEIPQSVISEKGAFFEITLPMKQTILSSNKYQKKFIQDYKLEGKDNVEFYYELTPAKSRSSYLRVKGKNATKLPWLAGESQIFLENEFMGKVNLPYTPPGKEEDFVLGMESRITSEKELVKKYEDTSGVFGGNRRIAYRYKLTVENQLPGNTDVTVQDTIPVSRNEKIQVELKNLSHQFEKDEKTRKSTDFQRGIRKWKLNLDKHEKKEITYEVVISFDKDVDISGLR